MKNKFYLGFCIMLMMHLCQPKNGLAQKSIGVSAGAGIIEFLHFGPRIQFKNSQLGFNYGFIPTDSDETLYSIGADYYHHYGKLSKFSDLPRGYFRSSINYWHDESPRVIHKYLILQLRIGREFYFSKTTGISIDGGLGLELMHDKVWKEPRSGTFFNFNFGPDLPIIPGISISLFFRL